MRLAPTSGGTACSTTNSILTGVQRQAAVNQVNNLRSQLAKGQVTTPTGNLQPGTNIYQMVRNIFVTNWSNNEFHFFQTYNCTLESAAQAYADGCVFAHSGGSGYGENLYIHSGAPSANPIVDADIDWWAESTTIGISNPTTGIFGSSDINAGHFTQVRNRSQTYLNTLSCSWHGD